jgi:hypothetical protein
MNNEQIELTIYRVDVDGGYQHIIAARSTDEADALARQHDEPEPDGAISVKEIVDLEAVPVRVDEDGRTVTLRHLLATEPPRRPCIVASTCEE